MLEAIDKIHWTELKHAYGTCENVPKIVRQLMHSNRGVRQHALSYISENLFHQGTHYEVNEFALPFLLEVAASAKAPDRVPLYQLLRTMLGGESIPMSPRQRRENRIYSRRAYPWMFDQRGKKKKDADSSYWEKAFQKSSASAWKCRKLLTEVIETEEDANIRCEAVRLLAEMARSSIRMPWVKANDVAKLVVFFRRRAEKDPEVTVRVSCALALGLMREESKSTEAVAGLFAKSKVGPVKIAAAAAMCLMKPAIPAKASRLLLEGILDETLRPSAIESVYSPLAERYTELGVPLGQADCSPTPPATIAVPFPELSLWLDACCRNPSGLSNSVAEIFTQADEPRRMRLIALLGRLHLELPELNAFLRSVVSNRRQSLAIRVRAAAALQERKDGMPKKKFETILLAGLRSSDPHVRRSVIDAVAQIPTFLTHDGFENVNDHENPVEAAWDAFGTRLLPLVVGELGAESDPQVRIAFANYVHGIQYRWGKGKPGVFEVATLLARWPNEPVIVTAAMKAMDYADSGFGESDNYPKLLPFFDKLVQYFHDDPTHRASAARLLLKIHSRHAVTIPLLLPILESDPDDKLRGKIAYSLYCQSFHGPKSYPREPIDDLMLRVMRSDRSQEVVRWACGWFNARLTEPRLLDKILELFETDARSADGQSLRPHLVEVLSHARDNYPRVLKALIGTALDRSSHLRHAAMDAFFIRRTGPEVPPDVCGQAMRQILDSGDTDMILWSLKRHMLYIGGDVRTERLPELAKHADPLVAQHAKEILEQGW